MGQEAIITASASSCGIAENPKISIISNRTNSWSSYNSSEHLPGTAARISPQQACCRSIPLLLGHASF